MYVSARRLSTHSPAFTGGYLRKRVVRRVRSFKNLKRTLPVGQVRCSSGEPKGTKGSAGQSRAASRHERGADLNRRVVIDPEEEWKTVALLTSPVDGSVHGALEYIIFKRASELLMILRWTGRGLLVQRWSWSPMLQTKVPSRGGARIHSPSAFRTCSASTPSSWASSVKHLRRKISQSKAHKSTLKKSHFIVCVSTYPKLLRVDGPVLRLRRVVEDAHHGPRVRKVLVKVVLSSVVCKRQMS